jgi:hypothetical protein
VGKFAPFQRWATFLLTGSGQVESRSGHIAKQTGPGTPTWTIGPTSPVNLVGEKTLQDKGWSRNSWQLEIGVFGPLR